MVDHADEIQPSSLSRFYMSVRKFYEAVASKMLAKFLFKDSVVSGLRFLNPTVRGDLPPSTLTDLARRLLPWYPRTSKIS